MHTIQSRSYLLLLGLVTLAVSALLAGGAIISLPTVARAQSETPTAVPSTPTTDAAPDSHTEADAVFNRITLLLAPFIMAILVTVIVVHRRSQNRRESGRAEPPL